MEKPIVFYNHGQQLVGMVHTPDNVASPAPAVAFFHGFTGTKVEPHRIFVKTARRLASLGFYALRFDFRGCGDSEGEFSEMTIGGEISDALKSLDVLSEMEGVDAERIGVLGLSMGGCVAASVSGLDARVKSAVLWAPLSDNPPDAVHALLTGYAHRPNLDEDFADYNGNLIGKAFFEELPQIQPSQRIQQFSGPLLIIHGDADETVPVTHGQRYYELMKDRAALTEIEIISQADHTFNAKAWEDSVITRSVDWFQRTLL
ncbi:MAG: alpha/beta fold hydrolase [Candidatus Poribacteria bacterium]|nr:alpha/beta fold hydrolase [Candidatus Poribacteria bacterium]